MLGPSRTAPELECLKERKRLFSVILVLRFNSGFNAGGIGAKKSRKTRQTRRRRCFTMKLLYPRDSSSRETLYLWRVNRSKSRCRTRCVNSCGLNNQSAPRISSLRSRLDWMRSDVFFQMQDLKPQEFPADLHSGRAQRNFAVLEQRFKLACDMCSRIERCELC